MTKREFSRELRKKLSALPRGEREERINFYSEMIDDRIEEGLSEEEAVRAIGSVDNIAKQIPGTEDAERPREPLKGWEIALLIVGSPAWAPILAAAIILYYSFFLILWSLEIALIAIEIPFFIFAYISKYLFIVCKKTLFALSRFTKNGTLLLGRIFRRGGK